MNYCLALETVFSNGFIGARPIFMGLTLRLIILKKRTYESNAKASLERDPQVFSMLLVFRNNKSILAYWRYPSGKKQN